MGKKYATIPAEETFLEALDAALKASKKPATITVTRMSNGALSVSSRRAYLGKIKLQGRKTWMQYMVSAYNVKTVEGLSLEEYIQLLKYWVKIA